MENQDTLTAVVPIQKPLNQPHLVARNKIMFGVGAGIISLAIDGVAGLIIFGLLVR